MKNPFVTISVAGFISVVSLAGLSAPSQAGNSGVETGIQSFGDLSMFYQALLNTGVINELNENQEYTIFAPINSAWLQMIPRATYPCFYSEQCRPAIAAILRDHIIVGHHDLPNLVSYGGGVQTSGPRHAHVEESYVHDYTVENQTILSASNVGGNIIYRIDGVITTPQELAQFRMVNVVPVADTVTTEKTIVKKTYRNPSATPSAYPAGSMDPVTLGAPPANESETTTVIDTYGSESQ